MRQRGLLLPVLTALMAAIALFCLAGYQVTSETASLRLLSRFSAALIEIDRWLPEHLQDLDLAARDRPQGVVEIRDLPVPVILPAQQIIDTDENRVRGPILSMMAGSLYEDGNAAFRDSKGVQRKPSVDQLAYWAVLLLTRSAHGFWTAALPLALLVLLAFSASILHAGRSLPGVIAIGAGFAMLASLVVWLLAEAMSNAFSSPVDQEVALIVRDGAWIGVRNAFAVLMSALGLLVLLRFLEGERQTFSPSTFYPPDRPSA